MLKWNRSRPQGILHVLSIHSAYWRLSGKNLLQMLQLSEASEGMD